MTTDDYEKKPDTTFLIGNRRAERGLELARAGLVRKIPKITKWQLWKVNSQSTKDTIYTVVEKANGELECDCPDFQNRQNLFLCKHIFACIYAEVIVT